MTANISMNTSTGSIQGMNLSLNLATDKVRFSFISSRIVLVDLLRFQKFQNRSDQSGVMQSNVLMKMAGMQRTWK